MIGMVWGLALAKTKCPYCPVAHHFMLSNEAFQRKLDHQMSLHANAQSFLRGSFERGAGH